jgi:osmotically-inducible protein OsmY
MSPFKRISTFILAAALLAAGGCASTSDKQGGGSSYFDDAGITTRVKKAIYNEPSLKVVDISVKTDDKVVQLSGVVSSRADVRKAAEVAGKVEGVKRVKNDLLVKQ